MGMLIKDGSPIGGSSNNANAIKYDNSTSGLQAGNVQGAVDEMNDKILNTAINTPLATILVNLTTESDINNYYDTVSNTLPLDTKYTRYVNHTIAHSVLGGGIYVLEGCNVSVDYEWQKVTSYGFYESPRVFYRMKKGGVWQDWKDNSPTKKVGNSDYVVDVSSYTESNPYTLPFDGYIRIGSNTSNQEVIAYMQVVGTGTHMLACTYPQRVAVWLPKGTKVFHTNNQDSTNPATYTYMTYFTML